MNGDANRRATGTRLSTLNSSRRNLAESTQSIQTIADADSRPNSIGVLRPRYNQNDSTAPITIYMCMRGSLATSISML